MNLTFAKFQPGAILSRKSCTCCVVTLAPAPRDTRLKSSECIKLAVNLLAECLVVGLIYAHRNIEKMRLILKAKQRSSKL